MAAKITRWGIIGPGTIAHNFADGLRETDAGRLVAIASRDAGRRAAFGDRYGVDPARRYDSAAALLADADIDAVYIANPHPFHAQSAVDAMRAGKAVLVEKPAGLNAAEVTALTEVAAQAGVFFMEAYMYRCHPQIARLCDILRSGEIGEVVHIRAAFGFDATFNPASRLYDPALAGGGILDVGGYPMSFARLVAGVATGAAFADPVVVRGTGVMAPSGVDKAAYATLRFASGITAEIATACGRNMDNTCTVTGTKGSVHLPSPWMPGRNAGPSDTTLVVTVGKETRTEDLRHPEHLFAHEAALASRAIAQGLTEAPHPAPSHADSRGNAEALDRWRQEVGYKLVGEAPATIRRLGGLLPAGSPKIGRKALPGVDLPVSEIIIGCDNRNTLADGAVIWDAWTEAGGNAFDTGFVYGGGLHEQVLGQWIAARGVAKEVVVIVKGAHTPYCLPDAIEAQLDISLERLGLTFAPIYIMHRDNASVPVGEFVDVLDGLRAKGKIGIYGGSNWTVERMAAANAHAAAHGRAPMRILNNNLSLAVMEKPVWAGCISSNATPTLDWLAQTGTAHLSWSSQARGYFLPAALRDRLPEDTRPETCFGSPANAERRARAEALAADRGVSAHNIATAWVLAQDFPSFALVGPRSPGEIVSTLPGLTVTLAPEERDWLNLSRDTRP